MSAIKIENMKSSFYSIDFIYIKERLNVRIVKNNVTGLPTKEQLKVITEVQSKNKDLLKIPRR